MLEAEMIYVYGNLIESRVRSQKAIALSSREAEFVSVVAGCSDGVLIKRLWEAMSGEECRMRVRSDSSSAARAMVQGKDIGRVRHLYLCYGCNKRKWNKC